MFDGIFFIDEVYMLVGVLGLSGDFGKEVIDMFFKFMEDYCDWIMVIVVGYLNEMCCFIDSNFGFVGCFIRMIDFLCYSEDDFCEIFCRMVEK